MEADVSSGPAKTPPVDRKMWASFERGFSQVQFLLDHNRLLINEINQNHESKVPESLSRNVGLIKELNKNIAQVVDLYANISSCFVKSFENSSEGESGPPPPAPAPPLPASSAPASTAMSPGQAQHQQQQQQPQQQQGHKRGRSS